MHSNSEWCNMCQFFDQFTIKRATPGSQRWVAVTGIDSVNVMMVDPASSQTIIWNAYEVNRTSQFNYFKAN